MNETPTTHKGHDHAHGPACGHTAVKHNGHVDYLHNGHLHNVQADHIDEHRIDVSRFNPVAALREHHCGAHDQDHIHGPNCGHQAVPHGDHVDYLVKDRCITRTTTTATIAARIEDRRMTSPAHFQRTPSYGVHRRFAAPSVSPIFFESGKIDHRD